MKARNLIICLLFLLSCYLAISLFNSSTENSSAKEEIKSLTLQLNEKNSEIEVLNVTLTNAESAYSSAVAALSELETLHGNDIEALTRQVEQLLQTNSILQESVAASRAEVDDAYSHLNELSQKLDESTARISTQEEAISSKDEELQSSLSTVAELRSQLNATAVTMSDYDTRIATLLAELQLLTKDQNRFSALLAILNSEGRTYKTYDQRYQETLKRRNRLEELGVIQRRVEDYAWASMKQDSVTETLPKARATTKMRERRSMPNSRVD